MNPTISAELATFLKPVNDLLTQLQAPGVNTQDVAANTGHALLAELQNLPTAESLGINGIAALVQAQLYKHLAPAVDNVSGAKLGA